MCSSFLKFCIHISQIAPVSSSELQVFLSRMSDFGKRMDILRDSAFYTVCPTRYRTQQFFNNFTTNEDIATNTDTHYRHIPLHFSHNERSPVQMSLKYRH